jgi:NAD(P)-dependent dehydrogenase (short-subunit alcohol dehydrogenase family)
MNPQAPLQGKVALVTGAARRIGRSLALSLAEAGASVAITWRDSEPEAAQTVADLEALGVQALALRAELRDSAQVRAAVEAAATRFSRLDILVNNAGRFETAALESITVEQWDAMFETNTRAPLPRRSGRLPVSESRPRPHHQHRLPRRTPSLAHPRPLLHLQSRPAHAHPHHVQSLGSGNQRELRRPRHDRQR